MARYKTAIGKTLDMSNLVAKNEKTRAVGNMKVNARGDTIDASGRIIESANEKVSTRYQRTVGNRSANVVKNKPQPSRPSAQKIAEPVIDEQLTKEELELNNSFDDDIEIENIKATENKKGNK